MKKIILLILVLFVVACQVPVDTPPELRNKTDIDFIPFPDVSDTTSKGVNTLIHANNQFAFDMYNELDKDENIFFSPYSITSALAMTYEGAQGDTAEAMRTVLHIPKNHNPADFKEIYDGLNQENSEFKLSTANALWAEQDFEFLDEYFERVETYYGGAVRNMDFKNDAEGSRKTINKWVEDQTNDKIKDLIPSGAINPTTRLVLTNAIYFKGEWTKSFNSKDTIDQNFWKDPDNPVLVSMMQRTDEESIFNYYEDDELQALELPYSGEDISMLILLPREGKTLDLDVDKLNDLTDDLEEQRVNIYIPKFKFETKYFMSKLLSNMGMGEAFSNDADFSRMTGKKDLVIDEVIHQAYVEVNEEGTEAAAATTVMITSTTSMHPGPRTPVFMADHPFVFMIMHKGNILFMGKVVDPSE